MIVWPWPEDRSTPYGDGSSRRTEDADVRLAREVTDKLLTDDRTRRQRITVDVQDRVVLLTGVVDSRPTRAVAGAVVRDVYGVRDVCNGVRTRVGGVPPDTAGAPTADLMDVDAFDEMVACLQSPSPAGDGPGRTTRRQRGLRLVLLLAIACLPLGVLMVAFGWAGMLIACGIGALIVERLLHRTTGDAGSPPRGQ
ncbi:BON domain-containing protein [Jidongwangia harbinensis]|uniref:BON domain-containing protein n=1 Tax=Jidongwangia harbinensis TaxID=2878561 RepID=UPI001CD9A833|nr:BON domain-containing protein [Jidongwangia harbinensis]MCA2219026.1 BON domain-containing protein [Jidongwangia harbinensis]